MLTLPAGTAGVFARSLGWMMFLGCVFSALFSVIGLFLGWIFDVPVGAITVILAAVVFLLISAGSITVQKLLHAGNVKADR
jgi:ABC-type Mn2+/Zn2+ transport system permease subunit